jgi:hypothetical protein
MQNYLPLYPFTLLTVDYISPGHRNTRMEQAIIDRIPTIWPSGAIFYSFNLGISLHSPKSPAEVVGSLTGTSMTNLRNGFMPVPMAAHALRIPSALFALWL